MEQRDRFAFLRTIGNYLERHIAGIDMSVVTDFEDGTGALEIYYAIGENEVDVLTFDIAVNGQATNIPSDHEGWMAIPKQVRAFLAAFNHIAYNTFAAASYADGLIARQEDR